MHSSGKIESHKLLEEIAGKIKRQAVIIFFTAPWCKPCREVKKILEPKIDKLNGRVAYYELDAGHYSSITNHFGVSGLPTILLFNKDEMVSRVRGFSSSNMNEFLGLLESLEMEADEA